MLTCILQPVIGVNQRGHQGRLDCAAAAAAQEGKLIQTWTGMARHTAAALIRGAPRGSPGAVCTPCPAVSVGRVIPAPVAPVLTRSHAGIPANTAQSLT